MLKLGGFLLVALLPMAALADPVPQSSYRTVPPPDVPGVDNHIPGLMLHYCDGSVVILPAAQNCTPVVVSPVKPLPVTVVGGGSGGGTSTPTTAPGTASSQAVPVLRQDGSPVAGDGTDAIALNGTAIAQGASGVGIRGWLATIVGWLQAIYTRLIGTLTVTMQTGTYSNGAITITTGGTAQTGIAAGAMSHGGDLVNPSTATEPLYFSVGVSATLTPASPSLSPGTAYHFSVGPAPNQAISVNAATAGHVATYIAY